MSENESTLRIRTTAEIGAIVAYTKALIDANKALAEHLKLSGQSDGGGGGGGGAATGSPPPAPAPAAAAAPAPALPQPGTNIGLPGGNSYPAPLHFGGANTGAPPPAAAPVASPTGGAPPASPQAPGSAGAPPPSPGPSGAAGASTGGGGGNRAGFLQNVRHRGESFMSHTASTAIGVGLGTSIFGLPMAAIQRYMSLSTVLTQLSARFRESGDNAELFGTKMGYGLARSAQLAEQLGKVSNVIDKGEATRMAGFARFTGADPGQTLQALGRLGDLQGKHLGDSDLAQLFNTAKTRGMDQGRMEEFLARVESAIMDQFQATGRTSMGSAMAVQGLPSLVYGADDPRRANDESLVGGLQSVMTGGGPMRSYMMRAMGYGRTGGPGYIEMRKRLDAGVFDPRNITDLFQSFQDRGMGEGAQFRALESVAGGSLKAHQIEALVKRLGTKEGLDEYRRMSTDTGGDAMAIFRSTLSEKDRAAFDREKDGGFTAIGQKRISAGESYENRIEAMMMKVGSELAPSIPHLQGTIESVGRMLDNLVGQNIGEKLEQLTGGIERATIRVEKMLEGPMAQSAAGWSAYINSDDPNKFQNHMLPALGNIPVQMTRSAADAGDPLANLLLEGWRSINEASEAGFTPFPKAGSGR